MVHRVSSRSFILAVELEAELEADGMLKALGNVLVNWANMFQLVNVFCESNLHERVAPLICAFSISR